MSQPIGMGRPSSLASLPAPPARGLGRMQWGDNALSAPTSNTPVRPTVDRSKVDPTIVKAAEGMEAMFLDYMMNVMRKTVPQEDLGMHSQATEVYTSMLDQETAAKAARGGGVGLADQVIAYLDSSRYARPQGMKPAPAAPVGTSPQPGGDHEGQPAK